MSNLAGELIMRCFHARTIAHVLHLKTKSYAQHVALQGFYEDIVTLADSFAESYQGDYGLIEDYPAQCKLSSDGLKLMSDLSDWIEGHREDICDVDDTYLRNIIDEIVALIRRTQYKLQFLK